VLVEDQSKRKNLADTVEANEKQCETNATHVETCVWLKYFDSDVERASEQESDRKDHQNRC